MGFITTPTPRQPFKVDWARNYRLTTLGLESYRAYENPQNKDLKASDAQLAYKQRAVEFINDHLDQDPVGTGFQQKLRRFTAGHIEVSIVKVALKPEGSNGGRSFSSKVEQNYYVEFSTDLSLANSEPFPSPTTEGTEFAASAGKHMNLLVGSNNGEADLRVKLVRFKGPVEGQPKRSGGITILLGVSDEELMASQARTRNQFFTRMPSDVKDVKQLITGVNTGHSDSGTSALLTTLELQCDDKTYIVSIKVSRTAYDRDGKAQLVFGDWSEEDVPDSGSQARHTEWDQVIQKCWKQLDLNLSPSNLPVVRPKLARVAFINHVESATQLWILMCNETKQVVVAFQGTQTLEDWQSNFGFEMVTDPDAELQTPGGQPDMEVKVHSGFLASWEAVAAQVKGIVKVCTEGGARDQDPSSRWKVTTVGHSLGGALASIAAYKLQSDPAFANVDIELFTVASPRPGNQAFADKFASPRTLSAQPEPGQKRTPATRLACSLDIVALVPLFTMSYRHVTSDEEILACFPRKSLLTRERPVKPKEPSFLTKLLAPLRVLASVAAGIVGVVGGKFKWGNGIPHSSEYHLYRLKLLVDWSLELEEQARDHAASASRSQTRVASGVNTQQ